MSSKARRSSWVCGPREEGCGGSFALERAGELHLDPGVWAKLLSISAATIDRALAPDRRRLQVRGSVGTKPGTLLKHQIPIP